MKRIQLQRWSGSVLSPHARPRHQVRHAPKWYSAAAAQLRDDPPASHDSVPNHAPQDLRELPSPPPSLAPKSARLAALHARLALSSRVPIETLARCLVDPTADRNPAFNNISLSILGNDILGYFTSELILCRYPRLPLAVLFAAMWAYSGPKTLSNMFDEWGMETAAAPGGEVDPGLLQLKMVTPGNADMDNAGKLFKFEGESDAVAQPSTSPTYGRRYAKEENWNKTLSSRTVYDDYFGNLAERRESDYAERPELRALDAAYVAQKGTTAERARTNCIRAIFGAIYLHTGRQATKKFFQDHIQSRQLNIAKMFEFRQPTRDLSRLCAREGLQSPLARILYETGRTSRHPVFTVGVFSGKDKLGEGSGGSLDEARITAAVAALKGWYLYSPMEVRVPSEMEDGESERPWEPVLVDGGEVIV